MLKRYKRIFVSLCFLQLIGLVTFSQYTISFKIQSRPDAHATDTIFLAGDFNNWHPGKPGYSFTTNDGYTSLQINNLPAANYEFKCTRGDWQKVECGADGGNFSNRIINLHADTAIYISIAAWKDDFTALPKKHTASANVKIIDTAFLIPQLDRKRRISIYLPPGYNASHKKYPVMYMQDGQNIFDEFTAYAGEWAVDECLDILIKKGAPPCIVVGIDNGPERMQEYNPYEYEQFGKGEGDLYVDFLVKTLKPFIDGHYRTMPSQNNTTIAGSSMGGLIAYYAALKYPDVFGNAGVFSPSFIIADSIKDFTVSNSNKLTGKLFFYIGEKEEESNVKRVNEIVQILGENSSALIYYTIDPDSSHNEQAWRKWFGSFYKWIMADGFNNVIDLGK
jgi:predicted alpha/beta superfamily hydrolase